MDFIIWPAFSRLDEEVLMSFAASVVSLPTSPFPPLAVGFFGLGTGYLIYGPQELFGYPKRDVSVNQATGVWGLWMPGFMQFITGVYLFLGLTLFGTFTDPGLYMAALAFTAYGVHWFAIGWNRMRGGDVRVQLGMAVAFLVISILGMIVFFHLHDPEVGGLFIGLTGIYACEILTSLGPDLPGPARLGERVLGFLHLGTGIYLMYLMFAVVTDFVLKWTLKVLQTLKLLQPLKVQMLSA